MMKISRSNYETWFADWLDGNLDDPHMRELQIFLQENPDLKEEFDELAGMRIDPPVLLFDGKKRLLKSPKDLPETQFEYLCVASLEDDLSQGQQLELQELVSADREKQKTFELIQKIKLSPPVINFQHKNKLMRSTPAWKTVNISVALLSAAAIIAMILLFAPLKTATINDLNSAGDRISKAVSKENIPEKITGKDEEKVGKKAKSVSSGVLKNVTNVTNLAGVGSVPINTIVRETPPDKIHLQGNFELPGELSNVILAASPSVIPPVATKPDFDDGRSNVGRFLARNFRERIMKEKTPDESPIKSYEIAEAGVSGLNKLLGWDMSLTENTDERGQLKSVRFSSKLLKFNAPVKNSSYSR